MAKLALDEVKKRCKVSEITDTRFNDMARGGEKSVHKILMNRPMITHVNCLQKEMYIFMYIRNVAPQNMLELTIRDGRNEYKCHTDMCSDVSVVIYPLLW